MNYTSIEQSKKLLELGLSPESADMHWRKSLVKHPDGSIPWFAHNNTRLPVDYGDEDNLPCWSVGALLELVNKGACSDEMVVLEINSYLLNPGAHIYIDNTEPGHITRGNYIGKSIMEVVYDFVVWLLENNYIKQ